MDSACTLTAMKPELEVVIPHRQGMHTDNAMKPELEVMIPHGQCMHTDNAMKPELEVMIPHRQGMHTDSIGHEARTRSDDYHDTTSTVHAH